MRCIASILPKEIDAKLSVDVDLFQEQTNFMQAYRLARQIIGADTEDVPLIELRMKKIEPEALSEAELDQLFSEPLNDPFDCVSARLAFDFKKYGPEEARDSLFPEGVPENLQRRLLAEGLQPDYDKETLLETYDEFMQLGLTQAAGVVLEVAQIKQSRFHTPSPPWVRDSRTWEDRERKRKAWEEQRQQRLSKPHTATGQSIYRHH
jgi:hypothetical protein